MLDVEGPNWFSVSGDMFDGIPNSNVSTVACCVNWTGCFFVARYLYSFRTYALHLFSPCVRSVCGCFYLRCHRIIRCFHETTGWSASDIVGGCVGGLHQAIFGEGMWTIAGTSDGAFLVGPVRPDVAIFRRVRHATPASVTSGRAPPARPRCLPLIDNYIVLYIAFVIGPQHWPIELFAVGTVNYRSTRLSAAVAPHTAHLPHAARD